MGKFDFIETELNGLIVIEPILFEDNRGYFMETFNYNDFAALGLNKNFVQDNQSYSRKGVLRGMHFQKNNPQSKLVRVIKGEVYDVAVDIRKNSNTYGKWIGIYLSEYNKKQIYIPEGFAHGFLVTSDEAELVYKCSDFYNPLDEGGFIYNDPTIGVEWPLLDREHAILSQKDKGLPSFEMICD
ncbi:MAG TPA: dTDP-4-dehydrorhamnose 3,5-epimerase [Clostridia bacterium]|nr:dTDP-4-dehydrorhamnose 3,5-epimerase [Clostridia bacterium]